MIFITVVIVLGHLFGMIIGEVRLSEVHGLLIAFIRDCIIVSFTLYLIRIIIFNALIMNIY